MPVRRRDRVAARRRACRPGVLLDARARRAKPPPRQVGARAPIPRRRRRQARRGSGKIRSVPPRQLFAPVVPPATRVRAWWRASRLDAELAAGGDPWSTRELLARSCRLLSPRTRATLAKRLDRLLADASRPELVIRPAPIHRHAVLDAREVLLAVLERLRGVEPVGLRGVAATSRLLGDGAGPLYDARAGVSLLEAAEQILPLLDPDTDAGPARAPWPDDAPRGRRR